MLLHGAIAAIEGLQVATLTIKLNLILERAAGELQGGGYNWWLVGCRNPYGFMVGLNLGGLFQSK